MNIEGIIKSAARTAIAKVLKQAVSNKEILIKELREKVKAAKEYHKEKDNKRSAMRLQDAEDELAAALKNSLSKNASEAIVIKFEPGQIDGIVKTCLEMSGADKEYKYDSEGSTVKFTPSTLKAFKYFLLKAMHPSSKLDKEDMDSAKECLELIINHE